MQHFKYGNCDVVVAPTNEALGAAAAEQFAGAVNKALGTREEIAVVLAAQAASQATFIQAIIERSDINWSRITVFPVDEYLGIGGNNPVSGQWRTHENLIRHVKPKAFHPMRGDNEPVEEELRRYTELLREAKPSICVMGIGESGHLAFNDPPADFETHDLVRVVALNDTTRNQILRSGRFPSFDAVPKFGISLTMHALLLPETVMILVPERSKAEIIHTILDSPVSIMCPASIIQTRKDARLYLDEDSASLVTNRQREAELATSGE